MKKRESLGSRLGFIMLSVGCAGGLGNVWRFPYVAGAYGGGIFVLLYVPRVLLENFYSQGGIFLPTYVCTGADLTVASADDPGHDCDLFFGRILEFYPNGFYRIRSECLGGNTAGIFE